MNLAAMTATSVDVSTRRWKVPFSTCASDAQEGVHKLWSVARPGLGAGSWVLGTGMVA